jgi:hypothetical protein
MSDSHNNRRRRDTPSSSATAVATKVVTTAVVAYGAYRLVDWAWNTWSASSTSASRQQQQQEETEDTGTNLQGASSSSRGVGKQDNNIRQSAGMLHSYTLQRQRRRQDRLARCQRECSQAWNALSAALIPVIDQATDTKDATQRIKELRKSSSSAAAAGDNSSQQAQTELWETVKVLTVTRWIATAYAQSMLILVLQVQVHLWGAQLWHELQSQDETTAATASLGRMESYRQAHQTVLQQTFRYFFETGLPALCATVQKATIDILADWDVFDPTYLHVSRQMFVEQAIQRITAIVEERHVLRATCRRSLWRFFVPPAQIAVRSVRNEGEDDDDDDINEEEENPLLAETWDWIESPLLADALQATLSEVFDYGTSDCLPWTHNASDDTTLSLAQILPQLKKAVKGFHARPDHPLWTRVQALHEVHEIGDLCFR